MRLFEIELGTKVLVKSQSIKLQLLDDLHLPVADKVEWLGTVTDEWFEFSGVWRRLVMPSIDFYGGYGVWLKNVEVEVIV